MELPGNIRSGGQSSGGNELCCSMIQVQLRCVDCAGEVPPQPCSQHENIMRCFQAHCRRQKYIRCEKCKQEYRISHPFEKYEEN